MKSSQVRDLARRYATGKLSQESYRSQRRSLIDSITGGSAQLSYREDERTASRPGSHAKRTMVIALVVIIAAAVVVVVVKRSAGGHAAGAQAAATPALPPAPPADPGVELVRTFVETNDWTDGSLQTFERRWDSLGADGQASAKGSMMYPRLMSGVRQQIDSEKAVTAAGAGTDGAHLLELQKMAKTLGIPAT